MAKKTPAYAKKVQDYLDIIAAYDREYAKWESRAKKINKRYRDERPENNNGKKYPILWSNLQSLIPAAYARVPSPIVRRRFSDDDQVGRVASLILERALEFEMTHYQDFGETALACITDRFLGGRGTPWIRYEAEFTKEQAIRDPEPSIDPAEAGDVQDNEGEPEYVDIISDERAPVDYIHWRDFGHNVVRTWSEVTVIWKRVYLDRDECVKQFGEEIGSKIPLDSSPTDDMRSSKADIEKKAMIYELWNKDDGTVCWISKSYPEVLKEEDDPLDLEGFFPAPKPLYSTLTNDTLIPVPDFVYYQDQAETLDILQQRIHDLIKSLKVAGVYDASIAELQRLFTEGTNTGLVPVTDWARFADKNGLKGSIDIVDLTHIANALNEAYNALEKQKAEVDYITGLADIVHGVGQAGETATAQGIKGNYVGLRLNCSQGQIAQFLSDVIRIKAQIVATYSPKTLAQIAAVDQMSMEDQQLVGQAMQMIANKPIRTFRIEVDADSLVNIDEAQERADRSEFINAFGSALQKATPLITQAPQVAPIVIELLKYGAGAYKGAESLEGTLDAALDQIKEWVKQKESQPPTPDPETMKIQAQQQLEQQKVQNAKELAQFKAQLDTETERQKQALQQQQVEAQNASEARQDAFKTQLEAHADMLKTQYDQQTKGMQEAFDRWKAELEAATKIVVAMIGAQQNPQESESSANQMVSKNVQ